MNNAERGRAIQCLEYYGDKLGCKAEFDLAIKALKKERAYGEWIPITDSLPKIDAENGWKASDTVLVCLADGMMHMGFYCEDKKWRFCESGEAKEPFWKDVIAWMPLPESYNGGNSI